MTNWTPSKEYTPGDVVTKTRTLSRWERFNAWLRNPFSVPPKTVSERFVAVWQYKGDPNWQVDPPKEA